MSKFKDIAKLFAGRHSDRDTVVLCVRWYLRYKLSLRDLVEMMAERVVCRSLTRRSCGGYSATRRNSPSAGTALVGLLVSRGASMRLT